VPLVTQAVSEKHTAEFALQWMLELGSSALLVANEGEYVGALSRTDAAANASLKVREIVRPLGEPLPADEDVRKAAAEFVDKGRAFAPVEQEGKIIGLVTPQQLLEELSCSWDPLTGLPWSDRLREWGSQTLAASREITIIFFDLNDFGHYNKQYGHIMGDRVLKAFVEQVNAFIDPDSDTFVRYGGDEFVLGTTRLRSDAEDLAKRIKLQPIRIPDLDVPVEFSIGISGGKRSKERLSVHYAATLDNLINLASKDCLDGKRATKAKRDFAERQSNGQQSKGNGSKLGIIEGLRKRLKADKSGVALEDAVFVLNEDGQRTVTVLGSTPTNTGTKTLKATAPLDKEAETALAEALSKLVADDS
jgi:diguanylate cyclase (GGDEF)-like protein